MSIEYKQLKYKFCKQCTTYIQRPPYQTTLKPSTTQFKTCVTYSIKLLPSSQRRPKPNGPRKQRPMSEGAFNLSSWFSTGPPNSAKDEGDSVIKPQPHPRWSSMGMGPRRPGGDLPSLLEQMSLRGRRGSGGAFSDDMASLPPKRVNFFSSLRLKKRELSESEGAVTDGQDHIRTVLSNLRNKGECFYVSWLEKPRV